MLLDTSRLPAPGWAGEPAAGAALAATVAEVGPDLPHSSSPPRKAI